MKLKVGDEVWAGNDYNGPYLVEVLEIHDDIGDYSGLTGPGFVGQIIQSENGLNVSDEALELCFTMSQIDTTRNELP